MTINLEVNVAGRFKVLDQPYASPSKCAFCSLGHNQDGTVMFIDTTLDLDFYGVVYICSNCLSEVAESLGYISKSKWGDIKLALDDKLNAIDILKAENDGLRSALNLLTGHRCVDNSIPEPPISEAKEDPNYEDPTSGITTAVEPSEPESDTSSSESGLSDVRGTSEPEPISEPESKPKPRKPIKPVELDL